MLRNIGMNSNFTIKVKKQDLLDKLNLNRTMHITMVAEAKEGYKKEAERLLKERLRNLKSSEDPVHLNFALKMPIDRTSEYDSVIRMLDLHQDDILELSVSDFDRLYEDKWDWMYDFMTTNSMYSGTVAEAAKKISF